MAKPISLSFSGKESHFDHVKLDRSKLYGKRKRVAYDPEGKECSRHSLTADGRLVIKSGMTAQGYFTDEGRWIPNKDLVGMDSTGKPIPLVPSTLGVVQELSTPCLPELLLDLKPTTVYMLDPSALDSALEEQLVKGSIFKFALNY